MKVLITGSFRQHCPDKFAEAISTAELVGIEIDEIVTGGWVGVDQLAKDYAKRHGIKVSYVNLLKQPMLPKDVDAVILVSCFGDIGDLTGIEFEADVARIPVVVW
jgi:hypothetical protein